MEKKGFFEDRPGVKSSVRLVYVTGAWWVLLMASYMCYKGVYSPYDIGIFIGIGLGALGGTKVFSNKNKTKVGEPNEVK